MFKIGDEVMDKDGRQYTVMGVGFSSYEVLDSNGNMQAGLSHEWLAPYDPLLSGALLLIAEKVALVAELMNTIENQRAILFEKARKR